VRADVTNVLDGLPDFWPAILVALALAAALAVPLGRLLTMPAWVVLTLLGSLGLIAAATLTPAPMSYLPAGHDSTCLTAPLTLPSLLELSSVNETSLNVALFVPLGVACTLLPRLRGVVAVIPFAAAVSPAVELIQYLLPRLERVCSSADLTTNVVGLTIGLLVGLLFARPLLQPYLRPSTADRADVTAG
jgi:hypothetical protein